MHVPPSFAENRPTVLSEAIRAARIGEVVTSGRDGLDATPVPLLLDGELPNGTLLGHLARANPQWRTYDDTIEALVIFRPSDAYVSPSLYPSKAIDGKVVPTWNYVTVHAWGPLIVHDDPSWVEQIVRRLTEHHEAERDPQWSVDDAPAAFIASAVRSIVGIEIPISRIKGKWKLSQNRPGEDAEAVATGLAAGEASDRRVATAMEGRDRS